MSRPCFLRSVFYELSLILEHLLILVVPPCPRFLSVFCSGGAAARRKNAPKKTGGAVLPADLTASGKPR
jgi:hypothetical protein